MLHPRHVPFRDIAVEVFGTSKHAAHVGDTRYVPGPDWSVRTVEALTFWRQLQACVNGTFELHSGKRRERWVGGRAGSSRDVKLVREIELGSATVKVDETCRYMRLSRADDMRATARTAAGIWRGADKYGKEYNPKMPLQTNTRAPMHSFTPPLHPPTCE